MARGDVEVLASGREPSTASRPWMGRAGWLAAGLLTLGVVFAQGSRDEPESRTAPPAPTQSPVPTQSPAPPPPARTAAPITVLPDEEVPPFWTVEGSTSETVETPLLRSSGRIASVRVQCIGPGTVQVTAGTGRSVAVECPDGDYESRRFDVTGAFLLGSGTTLADDVPFEVSTTGMAEGSQWRVWTFLPFTII